MTSPSQRAQESGNPTTGRSKHGVLIGTSVAAVLVTGGITLAALFGGGDEKPEQVSGGDSADRPASPPRHQELPDGKTTADSTGSTAETAVRRLAEKAVTALNERDVRLAESIACEPSRIGDDFGSRLPTGTHVRLVGSPTIDGDQASVSTEFSGHGTPSTADMPIRRNGSGWCVIMRAST